MGYRTAVLAMAAISVVAGVRLGVGLIPALAAGLAVFAFGEGALRVTWAWDAWRNDPWRNWSHVERAIATMAGRELANQEIANLLGLNQAALTQHLHIIYTTPGIANRQQLVQFMQRHKGATWIPPASANPVHEVGAGKARWEWVAELALGVGVIAIGLTLIPIETIGAARWWAAAALSVLGAVGCLLSTLEYVQNRQLRRGRH
jgi:DNA-binding CsgD family transcriptional regulator